MKSLPTVEQVNNQNLEQVILKLDPELYMIKIALAETGVNPMILPKIIRSIGNMHMGTGYGRIQMFMENGRITMIKGEESVVVQEDAVLDTL